MCHGKEVGSLTNFGHDTANNQLLLSGGLDSLAEFLVVPCVDLALTANKSGIGVHVGDLFQQKAVGTRIGRRSQNSRQIKDIADGGVRKHVVAEVIGAIVTHELGQTNLVIDDQESLKYSSIPVLEQAQFLMTYRIILVQSVPCLSGDRESQQEGCLDDLEEVHFEVLQRTIGEIEEALGVLEILS